MLFPQEVPSGIYVLPKTLGATVIATAEALRANHEQCEPSNLLYMEKRGGFSCGTCAYAKPTNATHGRCVIMHGSIHLTDGCCLAWSPDPNQLHLYKDSRS